MREFLIKEEQIQTVLGVLGEVPAKLSFNAMSLMVSLPLHIAQKIPTTKDEVSATK